MAELVQVNTSITKERPMDNSTFFDFNSKTFQIRFGKLLMLFIWRTEGWDGYCWNVSVYLGARRKRFTFGR